MFQMVTMCNAISETMGVNNGDGKGRPADESPVEAEMDPLALAKPTQRLCIVWKLLASSCTLVFDRPAVQKTSVHVRDKLGKGYVEA